MSRGTYDFTVYASGIVYSSVYTSLDDELAAARLNAAFPTGAADPWTIADEPFRTGEQNPCPCSDKPATHRHILFVVASMAGALQRLEDAAALALEPSP